MFDVIHPLLGVEPTELATILERANPQAKRVLDAMGRLHALRRKGHEALQQRVQQYSNAQWPGSGAGLSTICDGVVPGDLFQALLATEATTLFAPLENELVLDDALQRAKLCAERLVDAPEPLEGATLDPAWAQRWALAEQRHGARTIDLPYLIASLGLGELSSLAQFSTEYLEGNGSARDVSGRYCSRAADEIGTWMFEDVSAAYLDIDHQIGALDEAFSRSGRVLLVGPRGSGRTALLRAWLDAVDHDRPVSMDPHAEAQPSEPSPIKEPTLIGIGTPHRGMEREHAFTPHNLTADFRDLRRARDTWLEEHADELSPEGLVQAVIVLDPEDHEEVLRGAPGLAEFEVLRLPEREPIHTAMIWLAHTMEDPSRRLPEVLCALHSIGVETAASIEPWKFRQLLPAAIRRNLDTEAVRRSMSHGPTLRLLKRFYEGQPLGRRVDRSVLRVLGGESALADLDELDQRLHGPRRS